MRLRLPSTLFLGLLVLTFAPRARAQQADEAAPLVSAAPAAPGADLPPPGARATHVLVGAATTAVWYGGAAGMSFLFPDAPGAKDLRIPIAGPWLALRETRCADDEPDCSPVIVVLRAALTIIDGVGQIGGLAIVGEGLFLNTSSASKPARKAQASLRAVPLDLGRDGVGLGLVGTF